MADQRGEYARQPEFGEALAEGAVAQEFAEQDAVVVRRPLGRGDPLGKERPVPLAKFVAREGARIVDTGKASWRIRSSATSAMTACTSPALLPKCLNSVRSVVPAAAAISRVVAASAPRSANSATAARRIAERIAGEGLRPGFARSLGSFIGGIRKCIANTLHLDGADVQAIIVKQTLYQ